MSGFGRRFGRRFGELKDDEEGSVMVFAVITLFGVALTVFSVYQLALVSGQRIHMQNAADAAAYSGALAEANALNAMGQINDGMAFVHYNLMRYAIDNVIYNTLNEFTRHRGNVPPANDVPSINPFGGDFSPGPMAQYPFRAHNPRAPDWVTVGDSNDWNARWNNNGGDGMRDFHRWITDGRTWLEDMRRAQDELMEVTPAMVARVATRMGVANGATHVAVSTDLEEAFQIGQGFEDMTGGGNSLAYSVANRYARGPHTLRILQPAQAFDEGGYPGWWDWRQGRSTGYSQIRLCWNGYDWAHSRRGGGHRLPPQANIFQGDSPNGHWHARHFHLIVINTPFGSIGPFPIYHGGNNGRREYHANGGGHQNDGPRLHQGGVAYDVVDSWHTMDHGWVTCPTCSARTFHFRYSEVRKRDSDANGRGMELGIDGSWPRPLAMRPALLRSGVTVATYRPGDGIGSVFPASPWGAFAFSSAQVGYWTQGQEVLMLRRLGAGGGAAEFYNGSGGGQRFDYEFDDQQGQNFYYSSGRTGIRFGARLVPVARDLTWHPSQVNGGLAAILNGSNWRNTNDGTNGGAAPPGLAALTQQIPPVGSLAEMRQSVWH